MKYTISVATEDLVGLGYALAAGFQQAKKEDQHQLAKSISALATKVDSELRAGQPKP